MAGTPLTDEEKARIRSLHAEGATRNAIARDLDRAVGTITNFCSREGLSFDRSATEQAVRAHQIDRKAARSQLADDLLRDAQRLRERLWNPSRTGQFRVKDGEWVEQLLDEPLPRDKLDLMKASQIAANQSLRLEEFDSDDGMAEARQALGTLGEALMQLAHPESDGE